MLLEICVPTWNRASRLNRLLASLGPSAQKHGILVSVSDNASEDSTQKILNTYHNEPWLRHQRHPKNLGFDGNIDSLISAASGDYIWFQGDDDHIVLEALPQLLASLKTNPAAVWTNIVPIGSPSVSEQRDLCKESSADFESLVSRFGLLGCFGGLAHTVCRRDLLQPIARQAFLGSNYCHVFSFAHALQRQSIALLHKPLTQIFPTSSADSENYVSRWEMTSAGPWDYAVMKQAELFSEWLQHDLNQATAPGCFRMYCGMHYPFQLLTLKALASILFAGNTLPKSSTDAVMRLCKALPTSLFSSLCEEALLLASRQDTEGAAQWWKQYRVVGHSNWMDNALEK